jgi:hypothetical protein
MLVNAPEQVSSILEIVKELVFAVEFHLSIA